MKGKIQPHLRKTAIVVAIDAVVLDNPNPRKHDRKNLDAIKASLQRFGQQRAILVEKDTERIIAGNGTTIAARELGWEDIAITYSDQQGDDATAYGMTDNRTAELATWDDEVLAELLKRTTNTGQQTPGWSDAEIEAILNPPDPSDASLLEKLKVTIGEPDATVKRHEQWMVGRHLLVVADPMTEVPQWRALLTDNMLFCAYPGPFVPLTKRATDTSMLLVQPDPYIAGHMIDRYRDVHGATSCQLQR